MNRNLNDLMDDLCQECEEKRKKTYIGKILQYIEAEQLMPSLREIANAIARQIEMSTTLNEKASKDSVNEVLNYFRGLPFDREASDKRKFSVVQSIAQEIKQDDVDTSAKLVDAIFCHVTYKYADVGRKTKR